MSKRQRDSDMCYEEYTPVFKMIKSVKESYENTGAFQRGKFGANAKQMLSDVAKEKRILNGGITCNHKNPVKSHTDTPEKKYKQLAITDFYKLSGNTNRRNTTNVQKLPVPEQEETYKCDFCESTSNCNQCYKACEGCNHIFCRLCSLDWSHAVICLTCYFDRNY